MIFLTLWVSLMAQTVKNLPVMEEKWVQSLGWEDLLERGMAIHPVFLPVDSHGQRNLEGNNPWGCKRVGHN